MLGFKPASQRNTTASGVVRGPGTGTSDSVKDAVPPGTYIMPADSTEKIGAEQLAGLGFKPGMRPPEKPVPNLLLGFQPKGKREAQQPENAAQRGAGFGFRPKNVPVNLSNGEFRISPEQVHAIGAQVLEGLKAATHTPAAQQEREEPGEPAEPEKFRTELFFADGGVVEGKRDPFAYQAPQAAAPATQPSPIPGAERSNLPTFKPDTSAPSPIKGPLDSMGAAYGGTAAKLTFGAFDSRADDILAQNREGLIAEPAKAPPPSPKPVQSPTTPATAAAPPATTATPAPAPTGMPGVETSVPSVRRIDAPGKAPLFTSVGPDAAGFRPGMDSPAASGGGAGFTSPDVLGILQRENLIRAGMAPLQDQIAFNGGGYGFRKTTNEEILRDMLVNGNSRDRATALGFTAGRQDAADRYGLTQQELGIKQQAAQTAQQVAAGELGLKQEAQGFQSAAARRQEALQARYDAAKTPEERAQIAQQIRDLSGKEAPKPDYEMAKARMNLVGELGKQYAQLQPIGEDKKPIPFETWAAPFMQAAGMGTPDPRQQEGATMQNRAVGTISKVGDQTAVWDGSKWVEKA